MTDNQHNTTLSERVRDTLLQTNPSIKPRWYFVLLGTLAIIGTLLLMCLTLFLMSFVFFILNQESIGFVPTFGIAGALAVLFSLPWIIILLIVIFVIVLEMFLRHISFAYRRPLIYSLAAIIVLTVFGGLAIARTTLHETLMERAEMSTFPLVRPLYRHYREKPPSAELNWGRIGNTTTEGFILEHPQRPPLIIIITEQTQLAPHTRIVPDAMVSVFGKQTNNVIEAKGIRNLPQQQEKRFRMK